MEEEDNLTLFHLNELQKAFIEKELTALRTQFDYLRVLGPLKGYVYQHNCSQLINIIVSFERYLRLSYGKIDITKLATLITILDDIISQFKCDSCRLEIKLCNNLLNSKIHLNMIKEEITGFNT